ncbi:MAG TPA: phage tail tip lysozyme [Polyangiaceae bacterium]
MHLRARASLASAGLLLAVSVSACGNAGPGEGTGESSSAETFSPDTAFANDQTAYDYFVGKGLTNFQAAGIVGNLDQESGVNPGSVQAGGPGRGIAQWSVGGRWDTDSNDNCVAYASKEGLSDTSLTLQLDFIWYELTTFSGYGLASLKASTNVTDATVAFETDFEGCGTCDQSTRISYAESVLSAYGQANYGASFVSQSFPLATTTLTMTAGQVVPSYIELKNSGTKAWDSNTKIGTTQPRDRVSVFADSSWVADNRPARVSGTVAPGSTYKFTFNLHAPDKPGTYDEFFGVVEESVAWFSDPGQGGPPDDDLEVKIQVVAAPADGGSTDEDSGAAKGDGGAAGEDGGTPKEDGGAAGADGGKPGEEADGGSGPTARDGGPATGGDGGWVTDDAGAIVTGGNGGGCSIARIPGDESGAGGWMIAFGLILGAGGLARRRVHAGSFVGARARKPASPQARKPADPQGRASRPLNVP